jgi:hypothetical protein
LSSDEHPTIYLPTLKELLIGKPGAKALKILEDITSGLKTRKQDTT